MNEREITKAIPLHDDEGAISQEGFARHPLFLYNREISGKMKAHLKEWDYYTLFIPQKEYALSLVFAQFGSSPILSIGFSDYNKGVSSFHKKTHGTKNKLRLETSSLYDSYLTFSDPKAFALSAITKNDEIHIAVSCPYIKFPDGLTGLRSEFTLVRPRTKESVNVARSLNKNEKGFLLYEKVPTLLVKEGYLIREESRDNLAKEGATGQLTWVRSCFTGKGSYISASASASPLTSKVTGIAFERFSENALPSCNAFFTGDRLHRLGDVKFESGEDIMKPWRFFDDEGKVALSFAPKTIRIASGKSGFLSSDEKQLFGYFDGLITDEEGKKYEISHMQGLVECFESL